jgi:predicted nucleic acid-binding protein
MAFTALLDACVLYPAPLRDILLRLALADLYRAKWSEQIHQEWMRNLAANRQDIPWERIEGIRQLMDSHTRDALVQGHEPLVAGLELPDPQDRHVLAAAIVARADLIVTYNLKDFATESIAQYGIEAQHPDQFLLHQFDLAPDLVCAVVRELRAGLKKPPRSIEEYLANLEKHQLPQFAGALRARSDSI